MNTSPNPELAIKVRYLGPIISLDGELSARRQNVVFARNGAGKSFLSRGLRCLDLCRDDEDLDRAARHLVSDESQDSNASLTVSRGSEIIGSLSLEIRDGNDKDLVERETKERIFHVFSEDFVQEELRVKEFRPDGNIEGQIAVDSKNFKLEQAKEAVAVAKAAEADGAASLRQAFEVAKDLEVVGKAKVNKQLNEYKALDFEKILSSWRERPEAPSQSFSDILLDLGGFNSIPAEPDYPDIMNYMHDSSIEVDEIRKSLAKTTSLSTVAEDIKEKIKHEPDFFEIGTRLVVNDRDRCPYCEQDITEPTTDLVIKAYITYFEGEEEKHKSALRNYLKNLKDRKLEATKLSSRIELQRNRFDALKRIVPPHRDVSLHQCESEINQVCDAIDLFVDTIEKKIDNVDQVVEIPIDSLDESVSKLDAAVEENNVKVKALQKTIGESQKKSTDLRRDACIAFGTEFARNHWKEIENIFRLRVDVKAKSDALSIQQHSGTTADVKESVAETFELLVRHFFSKKYVFDRDNFVLKRDNSEMARGPHRTLSDGEKTAIAFCYFIACIHRKVKRTSDYKKLFLVFDDPVTSMSYDFVFTIAQTLKDLSVSTRGKISINPGDIRHNIPSRPELVILTHNSYFFNILLMNRIVDEKSAFALYSEDGQHQFTQLSKYIAPFQEQLIDIVKVANNSRQPDHHTGNAIRSVLEAIGRFCHPDKSDSLGSFIRFLGNQGDFHIQSVIINNLSHGTYYQETPSPDELRQACDEVVKVVNRYAPGQLKVIPEFSGT